MSKLHAKDLMIGDFVCFDGDTEYTNPVQIDGISTKEACVDGDWYDVWEPIPLTTEIIEKNGFERTWQNDFVYDNEDMGLIITFHPKETNYTNGTYDYIDIEKGCVTITEMPIEFVHELQRVLRILETNKDIVL